MPPLEMEDSKFEDTEHACALAAHFGYTFPTAHQQFPLSTINLVPFGTGPKVPKISSKAMSVALCYATLRDSNQALFFGSANKRTFLLGFGTPEGEFAGDLQPLGIYTKPKSLKWAISLVCRSRFGKIPSRCRKPVPQTKMNSSSVGTNRRYSYSAPKPGGTLNL